MVEAILKHPYFVVRTVNEVRCSCSEDPGSAAFEDTHRRHVLCTDTTVKDESFAATRFFEHELVSICDLESSPFDFT